MSDARSRFAAYLGRCTEILSLPRPTIENDRYMFQVGDRWIELRLDPEDGRVTFAALIYVAPPDTEPRADLVAFFNVYYLFNGGFSLVPGEDGSLYLCRPHRLASLDPRRIRDDLAGFAETAAMAGTWYIRTDEERPAAAPAAPRATAEAPLIRI